MTNATEKAILFWGTIHTKRQLCKHFASDHNQVRSILYSESHVSSITKVVWEWLKHTVCLCVLHSLACAKFSHSQSTCSWSILSVCLTFISLCKVLSMRLTFTGLCKVLSLCFTLIGLCKVLSLSLSLYVFVSHIPWPVQSSISLSLTFIGLCKVLYESVSYIRWPVQSFYLSLSYVHWPE